MTKILLAGVGSLLNYGCEGIVRGTYQICRESFNDFKLTVAVSSIEQAREVLADLPEIEVVNADHRFSAYRIFKGGLRRIGIGKGSPVRMRCSLVDDYDIFLSGGGDNICQTPAGGFYPILLDLLKMGTRAKRKGKKYFLWGASVGPFSVQNEPFVINELMQADGLFLREKLAVRYLSGKLPEEKLFLVADPAFAFLLPATSKLPEKTRVGLNLSPLFFGFTQRNLQSFCVRFSDWLLAEKVEELLLVPHVMSSPKGAQNDYLFLKEVKKNLEGFLPAGMVRLLPAEIGAVQTKQAIGELSFLIASRMHCCIAGCCMGVPTIFLTYSPKGIGMNEYVYEGRCRSFDAKEIFEDYFFKSLSESYHRRKELAQHLQQNQNRFAADAIKAGSILIR